LSLAGVQRLDPPQPAILETEE